MEYLLNTILDSLKKKDLIKLMNIKNKLFQKYIIKYKNSTINVKIQLNKLFPDRNNANTLQLIREIYFFEKISEVIGNINTNTKLNSLVLHKGDIEFNLNYYVCEYEINDGDILEIDNNISRTILIRMLNGNSFEINTKEYFSFLKIKEIISEKILVPVLKIRLIFVGRTLQDTTYIRDESGIQNGNSIIAFIIKNNN
jgi:hypothetical protein